MAAELFHRIDDRDSASVRRCATGLGLLKRLALRNVHFRSHAEALASRGGGRIPALWDGERLHEGLEAVLAELERMAR